MDKLERIRALRSVRYGWTYQEARAMDACIQAPYFMRALYLLSPHTIANAHECLYA